ncbi:MAG TPA: hypothetical protein PLK80_17345 [bacterium]|nr:hypothetical protein [bacterium]
MGVQTPFIFCGQGEGAKIAEGSGGSIIVPPEAPEKLAEAILQFSDLESGKRAEMGSRARKFAEEYFDREKIADKFMGEIENIRKTTK